MATNLSITSLALCVPAAPLPPPPRPVFHRRAALLGSLAAVLAAPTLEAAVPATGPDAELIRLCAECIAKFDACQELPDEIDLNEAPEWHEVEALEEEIGQIRATTLHGLAAKAKIARRWAVQPDGSMNWSDSYTGDWPQQVLEDLLRMHGGLA